MYRSGMAGILIIEDDVHVRGAVARALAGRGHDVITEATGMAGLEASIASDVDVVILDLGLPDVDGAEVLKMIRAVREIPIIVATARDDEREVVKLLDSGADDYVIKPFPRSCWRQGFGQCYVGEIAQTIRSNTRQEG